MPEILYGLHSRKEQGFFAFNLTRPAAEETLYALGYAPVTDRATFWKNIRTGDTVTLHEMERGDNPEGG